MCGTEGSGYTTRNSSRSSTSSSTSTSGASRDSTAGLSRQTTAAPPTAAGIGSGGGVGGGKAWSLRLSLPHQLTLLFPPANKMKLPPPPPPPPAQQGRFVSPAGTWGSGRGSSAAATYSKPSPPKRARLSGGGGGGGNSAGGPAGLGHLGALTRYFMPAGSSLHQQQQPSAAGGGPTGTGTLLPAPGGSRKRKNSTVFRDLNATAPNSF